MGEFRGYEPSEKERGINSNESSDGLMCKLADKATDFAKKHPWLTTAGVAFAMYKLNGDSLLPSDDLSYAEETTVASQLEEVKAIEFGRENEEGKIALQGVISNEINHEIVIDNGVRRELHYFILQPFEGAEGECITIASFDDFGGQGLNVYVVGEFIDENRFYGQDFYEEKTLLVDKVVFPYPELDRSDVLYERKN